MSMMCRIRSLRSKSGGSVHLPFDPVIPTSVVRSVGWSECYNFQKWREITLPCSYRSLVYTSHPYISEAEILQTILKI